VSVVSVVLSLKLRNTASSALASFPYIDVLQYEKQVYLMVMQRIGLVMTWLEP